MLREIGLDDVDCSWGWLEMALLIGVKQLSPARRLRDGLRRYIFGRCLTSPKEPHPSRGRRNRRIRLTSSLKA